MRKPYQRFPHDTWAIVLAAGEGTRLAQLTTDDFGNTVPKQFCSVDGGISLLDAALRRARRLVPREHVCMVVAARHEPYWRASRALLPAANIIVEPSNRGTAVGLLHGVLHVLRQQPQARIVFLPADHHVRNERLLAGTVHDALKQLRRERRELMLVGIEPTEAESEFGYILPGLEDGGVRRVAEFIEKPGIEQAQDLIVRGAVWNSFIVAAHGRVLHDMLAAQMPDITREMSRAMGLDGTAAPPRALDTLYARLPVQDFSRDIAQHRREQLRVLTAPACGWSDLGTPRRIATLMRQMRGQAARLRQLRKRPMAPLVNLFASSSRKIRTA